MLKDKSPEYNFLVFFNSINMLGWKSKEDIKFYWKTKTWSSILLFLSIMCILLDYLNMKNIGIEWFIVYSLGLMPFIGGLCMFFYSAYDNIFKMMSGNSVALNHLSKIWANCHKSLIPIIEKCDHKIISEENKNFLKNNPYDKHCLTILYEAWYNAINKEVNELSNKK